MNRSRVIRLVVVFVIVILYLCETVSAFAEGLLPSLSATVGIAMPSLGEALQRYPDSETENEDGSVTELYTNISETDFNTFSVYLEQQKAQLADYKAEKGVLTAEIKASGVSFSLIYNIKTGEAKVTYPSGTFDERVKSAKIHYDTGMELLEVGKTDEALAEFLSIPQYNEFGLVAELLQKDGNLAAAITHEVKSAVYKEVGNIVTFGKYPQTKEGSDQTPIEWIVLDYDEVNHKTLLLSRYGLDAKPFDNKHVASTWQTCALRSWLKKDFLNEAFNEAEKSAILVTKVDNSKSQAYDWSRVAYVELEDDNNTNDQIFLLSYAEANRYLGVTIEPNMKSRVAPTAYALTKEVWISDKNKTADGEWAGEWWLRSRGPKSFKPSYVSSDGRIHYTELPENYKLVRPAFWLNLESDIF